MKRQARIWPFIGAVALVLGLNGWAPVHAEGAGLVEVKMGLDSLTASERSKLWQRLDDYAKADSILSFCGRNLNLYRRTWKAVSPCVETKVLRKVGGEFNAKKTKYLEALGHNYPDDEKKKALCQTMAPQIKTYVTVLEAHLAEANDMCNACLWC